MFIQGSGLTKRLLVAGAMAAAIAGCGGSDDTAAPVATFDRGFRRSMLICSAICAVGGVISWVTIRRSAPVTSVPQASVFQPCNDPCLAGTEPGQQVA